ncbi:LOW QUALITY PROTEIN: uncharacterized protein LOC127742858 [Arachis duranensis]|uniref:LOW QUALITY PROTEIN: uncharacterized protein LOC127742858 n=1 Tax=Arachis duranensis TaxID=130453 RepID=A0A9C6WNX0_ARADU|nr:LOW QUALITY PROTEIN: uncharacterized protein LOC127742858 [Arachis duranensis]
MDGATKLDEKENHVLSSKEKAPVSNSLRSPLSEVHSNTRSNIPADERCCSFNNKRKVNELCSNEWLSFTNRTGSVPAIQRIAEEQPRRILDNSFSIGFRTTNVAETIDVNEKSSIQTTEDSPFLGFTVLSQVTLSRDDSKHARMERATKIAKKRKCVDIHSQQEDKKNLMEYAVDGCNKDQGQCDGRSENQIKKNISIPNSSVSQWPLSPPSKGNKASHRSNTHIKSTERSNKEYVNIGYAMYECEHCNALYWYAERSNKSYNTTDPKFTLCCKGGNVQLPQLQQAPRVLYDLLFNNTPKSKHFRDNIRAYNSMFQFTSMGAKIDRGISQARGPPTFILCGENYHLMGSLIPPKGNIAKFFQLYVFDTQNEIENCMAAIRGEHHKEIHEDIVRELKQMLDDNNVLVKAFRMVRDSLAREPNNTIKLRLLGKKGKDGRRYNLPNTDEVAALIVGDFDIDKTDRDIVVETQSGRLQRINQLNPAYLGLQYPLLFPFGEDGYKEDIPFAKGDKRRLFQQFLVDGFSMIESSRLNYIRLDQEKLRCEMYKGIKEAVLSGETTPSSRGKRIILPSSFTGGPRYMIQNYQDAMAICKVVGYPNLFITFTCNTKWPEVEDFLKNRELNAEDRPNIICRTFKAKLDLMIKDIRANKIFGRVCAVVYTIEFQKRGLPHAHILLFLHKDDKFPTAEDIDKIISAEIPDKELDPEYFEAVEKHMMHGPCGLARKDSPCMDNGKCVRHFPKRFVDCTTIDDDGYPVYRHVNKGHDCVTASFYRSVTADAELDEYDEVSMYYDCRYISPCEAAWRIFGFNIHYRDPSVVRLGFHLPDEQNVIFKDHENLEDVVEKASVKESMFLGWFQANKDYAEARALTYVELPTKFVWKPHERVWLPRKSHSVIGRIFYVPPGSGESYYMRLLLNFVRGPTSYEDIRTIDGVLHSTFKDACYGRGLLDDDKEYIDAIVEASHWRSGTYLRKLFATLLFSNSMDTPEQVWQKTWHLLSDDILHRQRRLLDNPDLFLSDDELKELTLIEIEKTLNSYNKSLQDFSPMPVPDISQLNSQLYADGMNSQIHADGMIG